MNKKIPVKRWKLFLKIENQIETLKLKSPKTEMKNVL
jgi:hypothetical protein